MLSDLTHGRSNIICLCCSYFLPRLYTEAIAPKSRAVAHTDAGVDGKLISSAWQSFRAPFAPNKICVIRLICGFFCAFLAFLRLFTPSLPHPGLQRIGGFDPWYRH